MAIDDADKDRERFIASLESFAKAYGMEFEANLYAKGVPGNPRPNQFIASACSAHLYVIADNIPDPGVENEPSDIVIQIFDDAPLEDFTTPPLAYKLKAHLEAQFKLAGRGLYDQSGLN